MDVNSIKKTYKSLSNLETNKQENPNANIVDEFNFQVFNLTNFCLYVLIIIFLKITNNFSHIYNL